MQENEIPISKDWLTGFIEGEGCFMIGVAYEKDKYPNQYDFHMIPKFVLRLNEKELPLLKKIKRQYFRYATINKASNKKARSQGIRRGDAVTLDISGPTNCWKSLRFFNTCTFHAAKYQDYLLWKEALELLYKSRTLTGRVILQVATIRDQMNNPGKKRKGYRTKQNIERILRSYGWRPSNTL